VVKVGKDGSSVILVPISTQEGWKAGDCIEIPPQNRKEAGVHSGKRSWMKLTEINKLDLPNLAIIPHTDSEGRLSWKRGRLSDDLFKQLTSEIGVRLHEKTLKGVHVKADTGARLHLRAARLIDPNACPLETALKRSRQGADIARARHIPTPAPLGDAPSEKDSALYR
jgi:hypothetical protein